MSNTLAATLELAPNLQMVEFDSSTQTKSYRIELGDGRHFQINETLYHLIDCLRTPMTLPTLANVFAQRTGEAVSAEQLDKISAQLLKQGILLQDGVAASNIDKGQQNSSILSLHYRRDLISQQRLAPFVRPLQIFFARPAVVIMLLLVGLVHALAFGQMGSPLALDLSNAQLPLLTVLVLVSGIIHELGHLAACYRWQCPHGPLGIGLYFMMPVFYVDVTAAWRLNRWQRAVVDIGGIYLQLGCTVIFWLLYQLTGNTTFLSAIQATDFLILMNLAPFMKLDGYWLLSDLSGLPNLHTRVGEIVKQIIGLLLWSVGLRQEKPVASPFRQWPTAVRYTIWIYLLLSAIVWPIEIIAIFQTSKEAIVTYPALWQSAISDLTVALQAGQMGGAVTAMQTLIMPTVTLIMIALLLKKVVKK